VKSLPWKMQKDTLCSFGWRLPLRIRPWIRAMRHFGLPAFPSLLSIFRGDFNLLADAPELFPELDGLPPDCGFCGPLLPEFAADVPASLAAFRRTPGRPSVFFAMGSSGDPGLFRKCFDALVSLEDIDLFAATLSVADPASFGPLPKRAIVERMFPMPLVLACCDAAVIHGGQGTVYSVAFSGVPFVGIPMFSEQQYNLEALARRGGGVVLDRPGLKPERLTRALREVLGDGRYAARAREVRTALEPYRNDPARAPGRQAARLILDFLDHPERSYFRTSRYMRAFRPLYRRHAETAAARQRPA
jgi:UDP:flavonoid glycosyltransferase YjiC (YdhE family)